MKYLELFTGIAGFSVGIEKAYAYQGNRTTAQKSRQQDICDNGHIAVFGLLDNKASICNENGGGNGIPECIGFSEIGRTPSAILKYHYPNVRNYGDATGIVWEDVPDFDLLCGGTPCQSWSIAGKRGGFEDFRGTLWFECFEALKRKQPKFFLFENVAGLLSHDAGRSMERICEGFCECGYAIDFDLINSKDFGVPQNRLRVFIIGIRLDLLDSSQIF